MAIARSSAKPQMAHLPPKKAGGFQFAADASVFDKKVH
jgi:hypothetical protein